MCASRSVVVGRLTDVTVERASRVRSGVGRIAVEETVIGAERGLPVIAWSDENDLVCPRVELDQFEGRLGVWFLRVDASGAFDAGASDFWDFDTATRILDEIEQSETLSPDLQRLQRAIDRADEL
jgi:hypothetical protein